MDLPCTGTGFAPSALLRGAFNKTVFFGGFIGFRHSLRAGILGFGSQLSGA
ncbi:hypothetical protein Z947_380 [Sulfitobacter geojensis]|nr:hypothetical protein Z947_380 [Sulfitobacter geojensis]